MTSGRRRGGKACGGGGMAGILGHAESCRNSQGGTGSVGERTARSIRWRVATMQCRLAPI